jgi:hypothetical protein
LYCKEQRIWFGTNNTRIYYSTNYGANWTIQSTTGEANSYVLWIEEFGDDGLTGGAALLKTTNHGNNWNTQATSETGNFGGIAGAYIITDNSQFFHTYYVRGSNQIFATSNNGSSWYPQYTTSSGTYRHITVGQQGLGCWAVKDNGGITFNVIFSDITQTGNETPEKYFLSQNYPNPFNPSTNLEFGISDLEFVSLKIYDGLGREVLTLVNETLAAGTYNYQLSTVNYQLPSGVYFYRLQAGDFVETKRMILLK